MVLITELGLNLAVGPMRRKGLEISVSYNISDFASISAVRTAPFAAPIFVL